MKKGIFGFVFVVAILIAGVGVAFFIQKFSAPSEVARPLTAPPPPPGGNRPIPPPSTTPPSQTPPPSTGGIAPPPQNGNTSPGNFIYSFNELKSGSLNGKVIHCSGPLFTPAHHDAYLAAFPTTKSYMVRADINIGIGRSLIDKKVENLAAVFGKYPHELPLLSILYTMSLQSKTVVGQDKEITEGKFDADLKKIAALIQSFHRTTFVRLAQEFNGSWNGYHQVYFANAFPSIVNLFKEQGVTNAVYMWNYMPQAQPFPYLDWYPGDDAVDWWSVDVFAEHFKQPAANAELKKFLADAKAHGKPVIIPESGPSTLGTTDISVWDAWFKPYFELINADTNIKGFCYSNEDFTKTTSGIGWKDVELQNSPVKPLYQAELVKPQYLNQQ